MNTKTHCAIWPVGNPYQINIDYARLAIEDSFGVAAKNDFRIFVDSAHYAFEKSVTPLTRDSAATGVECWSGWFTYTDVNDKTTYTVYRCYVYCKATGGFLLVETKIPVWEEELAMAFPSTALHIAQSIRWEEQ